MKTELELMNDLLASEGFKHVDSIYGQQVWTRGGLRVVLTLLMVSGVEAELFDNATGKVRLAYSLGELGAMLPPTFVIGLPVVSV